MKLLLLLSLVFTITVSADKCDRKKLPAGTYKARLEIKGLCMNYTLRLLEGSLDTSLLNSTWTDESTGKAYTDVFALGNRCNFPTTIEQGDEFYFVLDSTGKQDCAVCMAYYPTPPRAIAFKVVTK